jgi:hypothetical protein
LGVEHREHVAWEELFSQLQKGQRHLEPPEEITAGGRGRPVPVAGAPVGGGRSLVHMLHAVASEPFSKVQMGHAQGMGPAGSGITGGNEPVT